MTKMTAQECVELLSKMLEAVKPKDDGEREWTEKYDPEGIRTIRAIEYAIDTVEFAAKHKDLYAEGWTDGANAAKEHFDLCQAETQEEIVHCKDCAYWKPEHILCNDGTEREYTEEDGKDDILCHKWVTISVGINVGAQCFYEYNRGWAVDKTVYRNADDYCSRGERGNNWSLNKGR